MANRAWMQTLSSLIERLTYINCKWTVTGSSGAVSGLVGNGVLSVTPGNVAGTYAVRFQDPYKALLHVDYSCSAPAGTPQAITSGLTVGNMYTIVTVGTSTAADFLAIGLDPGLTPTPGQCFVATSTGAGAGTGTVAPPETTQAAPDVEIMGNQDSNVGVSLGNGKGGGLVCLSFRNASGTVAWPAAGTVVRLGFKLRNSSIKQKGE
jgi:hypothetical protein